MRSARSGTDSGAVRHGHLSLDSVRGMHHGIWLSAKHPTTGNAIPSPYVAMSQSFSKQANNLWYQIYQVVRENCSVEYKGATPHDDMMERLLTARRGG